MTRLNVGNIRHPDATTDSITLTSGGATQIGGLTYPTSDGTNGQYLQTNGSGALSWQTIATPTDTQITATTAVTPTSVSFVDFTNIPSNAKRITIEYFNLDSDGELGFLIGDSGGVETSGYATETGRIYGGGGTGTNAFYYTDRWGTAWSGGNMRRNGHFVLTNATGNSWVGSGLLGLDENNFGWFALVSFAGSKTLSGTLDRVRVFDTGSNNFTGGTVRMYYEV